MPDNEVSSLGISSNVKEIWSYSTTDCPCKIIIFGDYIAVGQYTFENSLRLGGIELIPLDDKISRTQIYPTYDLNELQEYARNQLINEPAVDIDTLYSIESNNNSKLKSNEPNDNIDQSNYEIITDTKTNYSDEVKLDSMIHDNFLPELNISPVNEGDISLNDIYNLKLDKNSIDIKKDNNKRKYIPTPGGVLDMAVWKSSLVCCCGYGSLGILSEPYNDIKLIQLPNYCFPRGTHPPIMRLSINNNYCVALAYTYGFFLINLETLEIITMFSELFSNAFLSVLITNDHIFIGDDFGSFWIFCIDLILEKAKKSTTIVLTTSDIIKQNQIETLPKSHTVITKIGYGIAGIYIVEDNICAVRYGGSALVICPINDVENKLSAEGIISAIDTLEDASWEFRGNILSCTYGGVNIIWRNASEKYEVSKVVDDGCVYSATFHKGVLYWSNYFSCCVRALRW